MLYIWEIACILIGGLAALILAWCVGAAIDRCKTRKGNPNRDTHQRRNSSNEQASSDNPIYSSNSYSYRAFRNSAQGYTVNRHNEDSYQPAPLTITLPNRAEQRPLFQERLFEHFSNVSGNQTSDPNDNTTNYPRNAPQNHRNRFNTTNQYSFRSGSPNRPRGSGSDTTSLSLLTLPRSYAEAANRVETESTSFIDTTRPSNQPEIIERQMVVYVPPARPSPGSHDVSNAEEPPPSYEEVMKENRPPGYYEID